MSKKSGLEKKLIKNAEYWLRLADKVYHYRCDLLNEKQFDSLQKATHELEQLTNQPSIETKNIQQAIDKIKKVLSTCAGSFYPRSSWAENVESFLVVAILAIGIRTFFFQPFKIPTNSMYPTYNGMTYEIYHDEEAKPNKASQIGRWVLFGARYYEVKASVSGELLLPLFSQGEIGESYGYFKNERVRGRQWGISRSQKRKYTMYLGKVATGLTVPADFSLYKVLHERFAPEVDSVVDWLTRRNNDQGIIYESGIPLLKTGVYFEKGDTVLAFDILTGDALFVDRFSYNFIQPDIGDPFVFRTRNINELTRMNGGVPDDKYYIKRLVGRGDDKLEIKEPVLFRNDLPIEGVSVFNKNADREDEYEGYTNVRRLSEGSVESIPPDHFYAMGDNSDESSDSRYFGYVPEAEVVGKAIFIYYPFSKNWGLAK